MKKLDENFKLRVESWRKRIADPERTLALYVAEEAGEVVGFAGGDRESSGEWPYDGELNMVYVLEAHQKRGIGRRLVRAVAQALLARGMDSMVVWVLEVSPYRAFYEALGGVYVGEKYNEVWGEKYKVAEYGWEQLEVLA